jgi:hypothetical protein
VENPGEYWSARHVRRYVLCEVLERDINPVKSLRPEQAGRNWRLINYA